jgi:hypothetical protein
MKSSINNASAHQHSGGPSTFPYRDGDRNNRRRSADIADVECEIAELINRSTHDLRLAWCQLHRSDPPPGLSRDLIIRALAYQLQERTYSGTSRTLRRPGKGAQEALRNPSHAGGPAPHPFFVFMNPPTERRIGVGYLDPQQ